MSVGGCSSFSFARPSTPRLGSTNETCGSGGRAGFPASCDRNTGNGLKWGSIGAGNGRKLPPAGTSWKYSLQLTVWLSIKSKIVPVMGLYPPLPGGGKLSLVVRCPKDVPASS